MIILTITITTNTTLITNKTLISKKNNTYLLHPNYEETNLFHMQHKHCSLRPKGAYVFHL